MTTYASVTDYAKANGVVPLNDTPIYNSSSNNRCSVRFGASIRVMGNVTGTVYATFGAAGGSAGVAAAVTAAEAYADSLDALGKN